MKFNAMKYNFEREISQIVQSFGKLRDLKYLLRLFSYEDFLMSKTCKSSVYV